MVLLLLLSTAALAETVREAFPPPAGTTRQVADDFGRWLGDLSLRPADEPVLTWDGREVHHRARVVDLPLVPGNLQQCADSAIRLRAEWLRQRGDTAIAFHSTSGELLSWSRWQQGLRPYVVDRHVAWRAVDDGRDQDWEAWLAAVFRWAGTASLQARDTRPDSSPDAGDLLVQGGSPGHAVVIIDVARRGERTWLLVGEGYMPAQDFHVELGPDVGWWPWTAEGLALPHWPMPAHALRTWR